MPTISMFYGIIIYMYYFDNKEHKTPHIHANYGDYDAVISIPDGNILKGKMPTNKMHLIKAWIEIHQEDLIADWKLSIQGQQPHKIEPSGKQMLKVLKVYANSDYTLSVQLSDGRSGIFDIKPYLDKGVFTQLKDQDYFKKVKPFFCGIAWPNEQDLSADTIAYELKEMTIGN